MATKITKLPEITPNALAVTQKVGEYIAIFQGIGKRKNKNTGKDNEFMLFAVQDSDDPGSPETWELFGTRKLMPEDAEKLIPKGVPVVLRIKLTPGTNFGTFPVVVGWSKL